MFFSYCYDENFFPELLCIAVPMMVYPLRSTELERERKGGRGRVREREREGERERIGERTD